MGGQSLCRLNIHWSERMAVAPDCVGSQIGSSTKQATASRASELRRLLAAIVAPVPSQIAVQVVRASAPLTFIPVGSSGQWWSEDQRIEKKTWIEDKQQQRCPMMTSNVQSSPHTSTLIIILTRLTPSHRPRRYNTRPATRIISRSSSNDSLPLTRWSQKTSAISWKY